MIDRPAEVGPWAKQKLNALQRYLEFYTTVLKNQSQWRTIYFDGFAGGGRAVVRASPVRETDQVPLWLEEEPLDPDQIELINGSPLVALGVKNRFDRYVFVEPNPVRAAELEISVANVDGSPSVDVLQMGAADGIDWLLANNIRKSKHRGLAFLDPFGAHLEWRSVDALAKTGLFEVVVNFALNMAIVRMLPNDGDVPTAWRSRLDSYFGAPEWFDEVYERPNSLFDVGLIKRADYTVRLLKMYSKNLKAAFGHVSKPMLVKNTRGVPLYYLIWAGPHAKGLEGANHVLQMGEKV